METRTKVVVLSDHPGFHPVVISTLSSEGFRVRAARSGATVLDWLARDPGIKVLILDARPLSLPDDSRVPLGLPFAQLLLEQRRESQITSPLELLFISMHPEPPEQEEIHKLRGTLIHGAFEPHELVQAVKEASVRASLTRPAPGETEALTTRSLATA